MWGFCWKPLGFFSGFWFLAPFDHSRPLKSGVSPLGKNPSLWGGTYLYGLYIGVNPPPPPRGKTPFTYQVFKRNTLTHIDRKRVAILQYSRNYIQTHGTVMGTKKPLVLQTRHYKPTETFQYTKFYSCHPLGVRKGFVKGEALGLLRTYSSQTTFEKNIQKFRKSPDRKRLPCRYCEKVPLWSKVRRQENSSLTEKKLPFVTQSQYHPA